MLQSGAAVGDREGPHTFACARCCPLGFLDVENVRPSEEEVLWEAIDGWLACRGSRSISPCAGRGSGGQNKGPEALALRLLHIPSGTGQRAASREQGSSGSTRPKPHLLLAQELFRRCLAVWAVATMSGPSALLFLALSAASSDLLSLCSLPALLVKASQLVQTCWWRSSNIHLKKNSFQHSFSFHG